MPSTLTDTPAPQWGEPSGWQLPLAQLCDSALPTGAFSHSFGLETYICEGVVDGEATFVSWLRALVSTQLTFSEGLGLRLAFEAVAADDWEAIARLDALLVAQAVPLQVRRAGVTMGRRMLTIARLALEGTDGGRLLSRYAALVDTGNTGGTGGSGGCRSHPAIVLAIAGYALGAPPAAVTAAYLQSSVISLTQNAVRAIPLGQDAGQRAIASVRGDVRAAVRRIGGLDEMDLGAAAPGIEISQMRHERQRARMFMS
ncbi:MULTISPECIES: urease accessory protein UreF [Actinomyces]|uniref:Urease accessory protein UreF n=1 Tax=Actinomyces oris TaxID=544580 RepID=A0A1Q8VXY7_9ACTO|nr:MULTISPECIES: urease accessory UreF family protein [Actinomyces]OFR57065.1 urease accessory protein UreF [Actinomyces sp. HMSC075C01]OLO53201.1 urease accessory protein UreF [Actinomyces oris]OLO55169.1 urease accessory protein UreF [Actinomyces oris]